MAAEIIEPQTDEGEGLSDLPTDGAAMSPEEVQTALANPADTTNLENLQPVTAPNDDIPDKYRGKSIKDVVAMHQEAEKLLGSQGNEVGELRKVVDTYITGQLAAQSQPPQPPEDPVDFFEDPEKAVSQAIESHPAVRQATQQATQLAHQTATERLHKSHPDAPEILQDGRFAEWVKSSPIRTELYARADRDFDYDAANELISLYKERSTVAQQAQAVEQVSRQQQLKAAQTGSGSGANTSGSKRVYRRADIIKLMKSDPDRYDALQPEIMAAYAEGRVR